MRSSSCLCANILQFFIQYGEIGFGIPMFIVSMLEVCMGDGFSGSIFSEIVYFLNMDCENRGGVKPNVDSGFRFDVSSVLLFEYGNCDYAVR